jgi:excisionase family DNA binding protein
MTLTPIENPSTAPIPPLRAEIVLAPETVRAVAVEIARLIIGFLQKLLQEAQAAQNRALLTPEEVAQYFQVNRQWVYERTSKNEIPHMKVGKYLRFEQQTIKRWAGGMAVPEANQPCGIVRACRSAATASIGGGSHRAAGRPRKTRRPDQYTRRREVMVREKRSKGSGGG